jgi:phenylpyruvate tautomerase PptA (4-oxalocrotonate tautomerase family)
VAQVTVTSRRENLAGRRREFSEAIHACVTSALGLPPEKRFHRFVALAPEDFVHPPDRTERYTIVELSMFEGRSREAKKALIRGLYEKFEKDLGIGPADLEITIFETPRANWGIRGKPGDELELGYKVEA